MLPPHKEKQISASEILLCVREQDQGLVATLLAEEFAVRICLDYGEAICALSPATAMIICGVHFAEGRMFDLLRTVKSDPALQHVPFIPVLGEASIHSNSIRAGIRSAASAAGADGFIDLIQLQQELPPEDIQRRLGEWMRAALQAQQD